MIKNTHYDVVFMDHMMPEMDGIEATAKIRKLGDEGSYYKEVPIIALTANVIAGAKEMFYKSGFNDFLAKPIDTIELNTVLEKWIPDEKKIKITEQAASNHATNDDVNIIIDGLNTSKGIIMSGGSLDAYLKTLNVFYDDCIEKIGEIDRCLSENNISLYTTYTHALKSACANVGAESLSEAAKMLETAGNNGDENYIYANSAKFLENLTTILISEKAL
jgi:HPt (histidine-containing phosphotransfer) domain-containing protein